MRIVALPGDGIGPEIMAAARRLLDAIGDFEIDERLVGGASIDAHGTALTDEVLDACRAADAVLLAAVGGPKWDSTDPDAPRPEQGLLGLRKELGLFANLRPARVHPELAAASALKAEVVSGLDILIVRELTGDIYFGEPRGIRDSQGEREGFDTMRYRESEIRRIARVGFEAARKRAKRLCSVDKANVLETSQLWREIVSAEAKNFSDVQLSHMYEIGRAHV